MKYLKKYESPNDIRVGDKLQIFNSVKQYPFLYDENGKFYIEDLSTHYDICYRHDIEHSFDRQDYENSEDRSETSYIRNEHISGRVFPEQKIISFWLYPETYEEYEKVLKDIENNSDIKFDEEWQLELPRKEFGGAFGEEGEYTPIYNYKGGAKRSEEEMAILHNLEPGEKAKKLKELGYKPKKIKTPKGMSQAQYRNKKTRYKYTESFDSFNENVFNKAKEKEKKKEEKEEQTDWKIYCDMDGVLSDFNKQLHDTWLAEYNKENKTKFKDGWSFESKNGSKEFWKRVGEVGLKFWSDMPWMPDGKKLWNFIKNKNVEILSRPSRDQISRDGKKIWCERELGKDIKLTLSYHKEKLANPKSILIDDLKKNIDKWNKAGGIGILHKNTEDTLKKLKDILK